MLVYGDASRTVYVRPALEDLATALENALSLQGFLRHDALTTCFIAAAELAQGLSDAEFKDRGVDDDTPLAQAATAMLMGVAEMLAQKPSGKSRFHQGLKHLRDMDLPQTVLCARAEGYAFYALYPEGYLQAAAGLAKSSSRTTIGIRSIGLGLAALVAAGSGAEQPVSVRPIGHPFSRGLSVGPSMTAKLSDRDGSHAVVDEGPGLSGSSFAAVIDRLQSAGVPLNQIDVFPSHEGDIGHQGSERHRAQWAKLRRHVTPFEDIVLQPKGSETGLAHWFSDQIGEPEESLIGLSGGNWRAYHYDDEVGWPASNISSERRKYLLRTGRGQFLLKFAGLGHYGEAKRRPAELLSAAGLTSELVGLRHGFSAERWLDDATPLDRTLMDRARLIAHVADYLAFRSRKLPATAEGGASLAELGIMLSHNAREGGLEGSADELDRFCKSGESLETRVHRVLTDNRLQPWEWLVRSDGTIVKTDAVDHAMAHDLVGCQDIAWDVAGAAAEFELDEEEMEGLVDRLRSHEVLVDAELLRFLRPCYLAFQLGSASMARDALGGVPLEAERLYRDFERYRNLLEPLLAKML